MTSENDKTIAAAAAGGKEQRPHATLDLTATEIFPGGKAAGQLEDQSTPTAQAYETAGDPQSSNNGGETAWTGEAPPMGDPYSTPPREAVGGFLSHVSAGLIGACLA